MLLDLSLVTQTLMNLLDKHIKASPEAPNVTGFTVSPLSPDKLTGQRAIGLYLYYISEDPSYKNLPPPSGDQPPIRFTPMGLNLYYQLTTHSDFQAPASVENEQRLMGLAMKALRDFPVLDDSSAIGSAIIFPGTLLGDNNRFRIVLQPLPHSDAMTYWTAGSVPMRLAVYYQVSVALLEPERTRSRTGRVLQYGVYTFVRGAPHLDGSRSRITFTIPGELTPRSFDVQPAEVAIDGVVTFFGSDLSGDQTTLLLKHPRLKDPIEVATDWGVVSSEGEVTATIQPLAASTPVVPGMYSAVVKVIERRTMPDKTVRDFPKTSNETPFVVTPQITAILPPDPSQRVVVQGGIFQDAAGIAADAVEVFVGPVKVPLKATATLNPGEYDIVDAKTMRFRYPIAGLIMGSVVPFRLVINGAESAPNWVTVP